MGKEYTDPDATTGTYAIRWAPEREQRYSKWAANEPSGIPGRAKRIVCIHRRDSALGINYQNVTTIYFRV